MTFKIIFDMLLASNGLRPKVSSQVKPGIHVFEIGEAIGRIPLAPPRQIGPNTECGPETRFLKSGTHGEHLSPSVRALANNLKSAAVNVVLLPLRNIRQDSVQVDIINIAM